MYASTDPARPGHITVVAVNKTNESVTAGLRVTHTSELGTARVYQLTAASPVPQPVDDLQLDAVNAVTYVMPPLSVSTLVLQP